MTTRLLVTCSWCGQEVGHEPPREGLDAPETPAVAMARLKVHGRLQIYSLHADVCSVYCAERWVADMLKQQGLRLVPRSWARATKETLL